MFCKICGNELKDGDNFCNSCGEPVGSAVNKQRVEVRYVPVEEKKKKKKHPVLASLLLFFGIFMIIGALAGGEDPQKVGSVDSAEQGSQITPQKFFSVGDVVEMNGIQVTLASVTESHGDKYFRPDDGNVFVICEFIIENNSTSDITVSSFMCFEAYFDEFSTFMDFSAISCSGKSQLDGPIAAGKKMSGIIGYQVPENWKSMEIRFTPDFWAARDIIFVHEK